MQTIHILFNFILQLDQHLIAFVTAYGAWTYALLFLIIFCETGIILFAILPGDSLLFAAGALVASVPTILNIHILFILLVTASFLGNSLNYLIGSYLGDKLLPIPAIQKPIKQAHAFYERYGAKTIMIARFIPVVRTFAPFIAGIGYMTARLFFIYSFLGALLWIAVLVYGSYLFGNIPIIKQHFSWVILAIIGLSVLPPLIELFRQKYARDLGLIFAENTANIRYLCLYFHFIK